MSITVKRNSKIFALFALTLVLMFGAFTPSKVYAAKTSESSKSQKSDSKNSSSKEEETIKQDLKDMDISMSNGELKNPIEEKNSTDKSFTTIFQKTKIYLLAFSGLATLIFIGLGIKQALAIASSSGNPNARSAALSGLLWILIAAAIAGTITTVIAIAWNFGK